MRPLLKDHPSTKVELGIEPAIGGRSWTFANGKVPQVHVDVIAIGPRLEPVAETNVTDGLEFDTQGTST